MRIENASPALRELLELASGMSAESGVPLPEPPYRFAVEACWSCGRDILVFAWSEFGPWEHEEPPAGRPETVQECYSDTIDQTYWGNTCPHCGKLQGDWFLYHAPGGPFRGDLVRDESPGTYAADMEKIAARRVAQDS